MTDHSHISLAATLSYAFRASLPVMAGYEVLGIGFGVLLASHGYAWYWAPFASLIIFAGSMQYVIVDLLATGAHLITVVMMTLLVNIRHVFYSVTMLDRYKKTGRMLPVLIFGLTDETFSLVCSPEIAGVLATALLHKWKHNTLLSILCGTLLYMFLVQVIF